MADTTRVLLVDDEDSMRYTLKRFLSDDGYDVVTASDCESALSLLNVGTFDVAVVDRLLPRNCTGLDIIKDLKKKNPLCQAIMISAYPSFESAAETIQQGVFAYLTKPVTRSSICAAVREAARQGKERMYLKNRSVFFHSIFDASPCSIVICDLSGKTVFANRAHSDIFGFAVSEFSVLGVPFVPEEDWEETRRVFQRIIDGKTVPERQTQRMTKDGRRLDVTVGVSLCSDKEGMPVGILYMIRDITEAKRMEKKLAEAEKLGMLGQLSSRLAHEIASPLQVISGYIEIMTAKNNLDDDMQKQLSHIKDAACRINRLHKDLNEVARPAKLKISSFRPEAPLEDSCDFLTKMGELKRYAIEKDYQEDLPPISASWHELQQVYMNLLINASHALQNAEEKKLRLSAACNGTRRFVTVRVEDTGCGIAPEHLEKVFDPFFTTREGKGGTGLGLPVVKSIVERYGGSIRVASTPGKGTAFTLKFPAAQQNETIH